MRRLDRRSSNSRSVGQALAHNDLQCTVGPVGIAHAKAYAVVVAEVKFSDVAETPFIPRLKTE